ncbi:hypothetical protein BH10ACT3_BH10ACT3_21060 [soil metagenome]
MTLTETNEDTADSAEAQVLRLTDELLAAFPPASTE